MLPKSNKLPTMGFAVCLVPRNTAWPSLHQPTKCGLAGSYSSCPTSTSSGRGHNGDAGWKSLRRGGRGITGSMQVNSTMSKERNLNENNLLKIQNMLKTNSLKIWNNKKNNQYFTICCPQPPDPRGAVFQTNTWQYWSGQAYWGPISGKQKAVIHNGLAK